MAFRGGEFTDFSRTYPEKMAKMSKNELSVQIIVNARQYVNDELVQPAKSLDTKHRLLKTLEGVLLDQNVFREIGTQVSNPDWSVKLDIRKEEKFSFASAILTGLTLFLIPGQSYFETSAIATVYDNRGEEIAELNAKTDVKLIMQLFFMLPWRSGLFEEADRNLFKDLILQLSELATEKG